jgi:hypothetical protein
VSRIDRDIANARPARTAAARARFEAVASERGIGGSFVFKAIRRGVFYSVLDLITAIEQYLTAHNEDPKPFIWTASADNIIEKVARCKAVYETVH